MFVQVRRIELPSRYYSSPEDDVYRPSSVTPNFSLWHRTAVQERVHPVNSLPLEITAGSPTPQTPSHLRWVCRRTLRGAATATRCSSFPASNPSNFGYPLVLALKGSHCQQFRPHASARSAAARRRGVFRRCSRRQRLLEGGVYLRQTSTAMGARRFAHLELEVLRPQRGCGAFTATFWHCSMSDED